MASKRNEGVVIRREKNHSSSCDFKKKPRVSYPVSPLIADAIPTPSSPHAHLHALRSGWG
jgi:hypothetical protein